MYATIDASGRVTGFYSDAVHSTIPEGAVEIADAQYQDWINNQQTRAWQVDTLVVVPAPALPAPVLSATGRQLRYALNASDQRTAWEQAVAGTNKADDRDYWQILGSGDAAPLTNPKLARLAKAAGIDLLTLFAAAVQL